ncbi:Uncharacterised protein [Legionella beliardensis]|uniref:Uncharacterized protein n=1 Tax=Legionella beliardensis TaxID=91822 RepID=A0A378I2V6_9GAMM|nr:hypothetical protein [Legionella beliardensis]STX29035.1 Uncharacterised protein [Legionella beliardensis]
MLPAEKAILESHTCGEIGKKIIDSTAPVTEASEQITQVYGSKFKKSCNSHVPLSFFWSEQPYQQGAYLYLKPGQRHCLSAFYNKDAVTCFFVVITLKLLTLPP